jgi:hypothetical protein
MEKLVPPSDDDPMKDGKLERGSKELEMISSSLSKPNQSITMINTLVYNICLILIVSNTSNS